MPLTESIVADSKPAAKPYKAASEHGLSLVVHPNGSEYWRLKYRFERRERCLSLGVYPRVSPDEARTRRDAARVLLAEGVDPAQFRKRSRVPSSESALSTATTIRFSLTRAGVLSISSDALVLTLTPIATADLKKFLDAKIVTHTETEEQWL